MLRSFTSRYSVFIWRLCQLCGRYKICIVEGHNVEDKNIHIVCNRHSIHKFCFCIVKLFSTDQILRLLRNHSVIMKSAAFIGLVLSFFSAELQSSLNPHVLFLYCSSCFLQWMLIKFSVFVVKSFCSHEISGFHRTCAEPFFRRRQQSGSA